MSFTVLTLQLSTWLTCNRFAWHAVSYNQCQKLSKGINKQSVSRLTGMQR